MADLKRIKEDIRDLAGRPKSIRFSEIERIVRQLGDVGYQTGSRSVRHGTLFRVHDQYFQVTAHNPGDNAVKQCYAKAFLEAMIALELLED